jgi:methyl-accepting chemotaxis protein
MAGLKQNLDIVNTVMSERLRSGMRVLMREGEVLGSPAASGSIQVGGETVPALYLGARPQASDFTLVDRIQSLVGGTATLFVKRNNEFVRISTNVKKDDGSRAIGTLLDPNGKAIAALRQGQPFYGTGNILGKFYLTAYEPIRDAKGEVLGAWYVGYPVSVLTDIGDAIAKMRILTNGFVTLLDPQGHVAFKSAHVSAEDVGKILEQEHKGDKAWEVVREAYPSWGYTIAAAFPVSDISGQIWYARGTVALFGLISAAVFIGAISMVAARSITRPLGQSLVVLEAVAAGDFTQHLAVTSRDEIGKMASALDRAVGSVRSALNEVRAAAASVTSASQQLTAASEQLASGAQQQASSLEETAASLEEITGTVKQNADNARQANQLAVGSRDTAEKGGDVVSEAVSAMGEINKSSKKIADIITTIDEIAFQTNLLALNAAVEAARAGEQGRGFAVVAAEVRSLAQRSATAAKEIKGLIQDSVHKVEDGSELVNKSGQTLNEIVSSVKKVTDIIGEIAAASQEQSSGIDQVNKAVGQMDQVVQSNAAQTEQLSSTAQSLSSQAQQLQSLVSRFKLGEERATFVPPTVPSAGTAGHSPSVRIHNKKAGLVSRAIGGDPATVMNGSVTQAGGFEEF